MSTFIRHWPLNVNRCLCSCSAFHLELAMYQCPSWAGTQSSFDCRILRTMWGSVEAGAIFGREESAEVKNHGKIGPRVCVSPKIQTSLLLSVISMSVYVQIVCSIPLLFFHLELKGRVFFLKGCPFCWRALACLFWMAKIKWTVPPCLCSASRGPSLPWRPALGTLSAGQ